MWLTKEDVNELCGKKNEPKLYYINCGGYAFGVDAWYQCGTPNGFNDDASRASKKGGWKELERKYVKNILKDNPGWTLIKKSQIDNLEIDPEKFQIVGFRIKRNFWGGFHFIRCETNGDWTWKNGHQSYISRVQYEDLYSEEIWGKPTEFGAYDGRIYFFIKERG